MVKYSIMSEASPSRYRLLFHGFGSIKVEYQFPYALQSFVKSISSHKGNILKCSPSDILCVTGSQKQLAYV